MPRPDERGSHRFRLSAIERIRHDVARRRRFVPVTIRENLTWEQVPMIEVNAPDLPGVIIDVGEVRSYPFSDQASHLVGYVGAVSENELDDDDPVLALPGFKIGKSGIEKTLDEDPAFQMLGILADAPLAHFRRVLGKLIDAEQAGAASQSAAPAPLTTTAAG